MRPQPILRLGACALALSFHAPAWGQNQTATGEEAIELITVTAQKREQREIDVPITLTAFDPDFLTRRGIDNVDRLSDFVPNLRFDEQSVNNPAINVRGITTDDGAATVQPRVSVFQDGVDISRSRGASIALFDLERVEVLKGPQSTLLGRGAMVGAINFISARPTDAREAAFTAEIGDFNQRRFEGMINTPVLGDSVLFRAAGQLRQRDGHIPNITGRADSQRPNATLTGSELQGVDTLALRGSLAFQPTPDFDATLIVNYQFDDQPGTSFKSTVVPPTGGDTSPFTFAEFDAGTELGIERELWSATLDVNYTLNDAFSLTSITSYRTFDSVELFDADGFQARFLEFIEDADSSQVSQEIRLNYDDGGQLSGFLGFNFFYEDGSQRVVFATDEGNVANLVLGQPFVNPDGSVNTQPGFPEEPFIEEQTNFGENLSYDFFADASYQLTDRIEITGGLRVSVSDVESTLLVPEGSPNRAPTPPNNFVLPVFTVGGEAPGRQTREDTFFGITGRAVVRYSLGETGNLYASYARGRRPEVIDEQGATDTLESFREETVNSYEVGAKTLLFNGRLQLDAAAFFYDFDNFRTTIDNPDTQALDAITSDAGEATAVGVEADARIRLTRNASFFANYAYLDAEISDDPEFGPTDTEGFVAGDTFRISPEHSFAIGADLTAPLALGLQAYLLPSYTWQSEVFFSDDNEANGGVNRQDSFGLLDIRGGIELADGSWAIGGFVENATDSQFLIDSGNTGGAFGIPTQIAGPPRRFGLEIRGRF